MNSPGPSIPQPTTTPSPSTNPLALDARAALRERLRRGEPIQFPAPQAMGPNHPKHEPSELFQLSGSPIWAGRHAQIASIPIQISHAIIDGPLGLEYATFDYEFALTETEFTGDVDLAFATFKRRAQFDGSRFHGMVSFRAARSNGDSEDGARSDAGETEAGYRRIVCQGLSAGDAHRGRTGIGQRAHCRAVDRGQATRKLSSS